MSNILLREAVKEMNIPLIIKELKNGANPNNIILSPEFIGDKLVVKKKADSLLDYAKNHYCLEQGELVVKLLKASKAKKLESFTYEDFMKIKDIYKLKDSYGYIKHLIAKTYQESEEYKRKEQELKDKKEKKYINKINISKQELEQDKKLVEEYLSTK